MDLDLDHAIALSLQEQLNQEEKWDVKSEAELHAIKKRYDPRRIVDPCLELEDPHPNIHDLYVQFDAMLFECTLINSGVEVRWSPRMTLCAGLCCYEGRGRLCSVRLSVPLLKLRPRKDLVETLIHEMIHAFLFVTENNTDHDAHGPNFRFHMNRINHLTGANITVYHSFHQEVNLYRQHWWKCNGSCQKRAPYYGILKRATNRAPSPRDPWWREHQSSCGGIYTKIKEPEGYGQKKTAIKKEQSGGLSSVKRKGIASGSRNIKDMFQERNEKTRKISSNDQNFIKSTSASTTAGPGNYYTGDGHRLSAIGDSVKPGSLDERRHKLLEAAEKRQRDAKWKGVKRKAVGNFSNDIILFSASQAKKPKLTSPDKSDCFIIEPRDVSDAHSLSKTQSTLGSGSCSPGRCQVSSQHMHSHSMVDPVEGSSATSHGHIDLEFPDDEEGYNFPVRLCPVCGRTDIPIAIINLHITQCLEDGSE